MSAQQLDINQALAQAEAKLKQLIADNNIQQPLFVGIETGGAWLAKQLHQRIQPSQALGTLDINFYRDDFSQRGLNPQVKGSQLPDSIEEQNIILIDDVLMTGRTVRAAMNELFDYGRPASIHLVALYDIGQRQLPIQADVVGQTITLEHNQAIKLSGQDDVSAAIVNK